MPNCPRCQAELPPQGSNCGNCGGDVRWWSTRAGQVFGPYDLATMQFCRQDGRVVDDDLVKVGDGPWLRAGDVLPAAGAPPTKPVAPEPLATPTAPPPAPTSRRVHWIMAILVIVCAIIAVAVMAAILYPVFTRAKGRAQGTACQMHLKQISVALQMYCTDNGGKLPPTADWSPAAAFLPLSGDTWKCPGYAPPRAYEENDQFIGKPLPQGVQAPNTRLLWCPPTAAGGAAGPHQGGRNVAMADGSVRWVGADGSVLGQGPPPTAQPQAAAGNPPHAP